MYLFERYSDTEREKQRGKRERERERERERSFIRWFTPQIATTARTGSG